MRMPFRYYIILKHILLLNRVSAYAIIMTYNIVIQFVTHLKFAGLLQLEISACYKTIL